MVVTNADVGRADDDIGDHPARGLDKIGIAIDEDPAIAAPRRSQMIEAWFYDEIVPTDVSERHPLSSAPHFSRVARGRAIVPGLEAIVASAIAWSGGT